MNSKTLLCGWKSRERGNSTNALAKWAGCSYTPEPWALDNRITDKIKRARLRNRQLPITFPLSDWPVIVIEAHVPHHYYTARKTTHLFCLPKHQSSRWRPLATGRSSPPFIVIALRIYSRFFDLYNIIITINSKSSSSVNNSFSCLWSVRHFTVGATASTQ